MSDLSRRDLLKRGAIGVAGLAGAASHVERAHLFPRDRGGRRDAAADLEFLGVFALIGLYVGVIPVASGLLHNTTEGIGIVAPITKDRPALRMLVALGLIAGGPTVLGAWLGGIADSPLYATLFLAVGAGAIAQVVIVLYRVLAPDREAVAPAPLTAGGIVAGLLVMYATGLMVA